jgi:hypothetical protein
MDARAFNREKMKWLNAISLECEVNSTAFRVAYLIADHQNSVAGFAWPSLARLAGKVCLSNKSIQRAVGQLERLGWLEVERTDVMPILAPRFFGSAAIVSIVSAETLNSRS